MQRKKHIIVLLHPEDGEYTLLRNVGNRQSAQCNVPEDSNVYNLVSKHGSTQSETIRGHQSLYLVAQSLIPGQGGSCGDSIPDLE